MQRFLWEGKNYEEPKTYAVAVNNFGVKPANVIATSALHKSGDYFSEIYPDESKDIKEQVYIDDELVASPSLEESHVKTDRMDEICDHAGMHNKGWTYSSQKDVPSVPIGEETDTTDEKVLGIFWLPGPDLFQFRVTLKFKTSKGEVSVSNLIEFKAIIEDLVLCRRVVLSNVSTIFDPIGFLTAVLLEAKLLMREAWCGKVSDGMIHFHLISRNDG